MIVLWLAVLLILIIITVYAWSKRTLQLSALEKSINKWRDIVENGAIDRKSENCECCIQYATSFSCTGCPVASYVNDHNCKSTPYIKWINAFRIVNTQQLRKLQVTTFDELKLAENELDFLFKVYNDLIRKTWWRSNKIL